MSGRFDETAAAIVSRYMVATPRALAREIAEALRRAHEDGIAVVEARALGMDVDSSAEHKDET